MTCTLLLRPGYFDLTVRTKGNPYHLSGSALGKHGRDTGNGFGVEDSSEGILRNPDNALRLAAQHAECSLTRLNSAAVVAV